MKTMDKAIEHLRINHRERVFVAIDTERDYQDRKWGSPSDHPHEVGGYLTLMQVHLQRAMSEWACSNSDADALDELRKVLALGVACAEQHGLPSRSRTQPVEQPMRNCGYQRTRSGQS